MFCLVAYILTKLISYELFLCCTCYDKLSIKKALCQILTKLDKLQEKKNTLMQEYSSSKFDMTELYQIRKNYEKYMGKEIER